MFLPDPKYQVTLEESEEGKHFYRVEDRDGNVTVLPGVTGFLDIIGGDKTHRLMAWATSQGVEKYSQRLRDDIGKNVLIDDKWIKAVEKDARKKPKKTKDDAADVGTRLHAAIDNYAKTNELVTDKDVAPMLAAFVAWAKSVKAKFVVGDTKVANLYDMYAGSLDAILKIDGLYYLVDYKPKLYESQAFQVAAYAQALKETYGVKVDGGMIIKIERTHPYKITAGVVVDMEEAFIGFLAAKALFDAMKKRHLILEPLKQEAVR